MNAMTAENLSSAYGGKSQAYMRYKIWGEKANKDGFPTVGRLFRATSEAEEVLLCLICKAKKEIFKKF